MPEMRLVAKRTRRRLHNRDALPGVRYARLGRLSNLAHKIIMTQTQEQEFPTAEELYGDVPPFSRVPYWHIELLRQIEDGEFDAHLMDVSRGTSGGHLLRGMLENAATEYDDDNKALIEPVDGDNNGWGAYELNERGKKLLKEHEALPRPTREILYDERR